MRNCRAASIRRRMARGNARARAPCDDLWVVQKDTNGLFAGSSRILDDLYKVIRAVPGVSEASPIYYMTDGRITNHS